MNCVPMPLPNPTPGVGSGRVSTADLSTEAVNESSTGLDQLSSLELVQLMNREDHRVVTAVGAVATLGTRGGKGGGSIVVFVGAVDVGAFARRAAGPHESRKDES